MNQKQSIVNKDYTLLVVDDNGLNRDMLSRRLNRIGYNTELAIDGREALEKMRSTKIDLVLLDLCMPDMDGNEVLEHLQQDVNLTEIPVIMVSAQSDLENVVKCIELGAVDYLAKPVSSVLLKAKVNSFLEKKELQENQKRLLAKIEKQNKQLEQRVNEQVQEISSTQLSAIFALSKLAESRDPETGGHLERIREYCRVLCQYLRKTPKYETIIDDDFDKNLYAASSLHDIGKVGIPDNVLLKEEKLTDSEWEVIKQHSIIGADTLRAVDNEHPGNAFISVGVAIAESHHEKWDGTGYPFGLKNESIPLVARIMALGDMYDALTSKRCYKNAFQHDESCQIILSKSNKDFDPDIVKAFAATKEKFKEIRASYTDLEG